MGVRVCSARKVPKARRVYAALRKDGWKLVKRKGGSHKKLKRGARTVTWAFHDIDLGNSQMKQIANEFGYTLEELRGLL